MEVETMHGMKIALLGDDGSSRAAMAAEWAQQLAVAIGLELRVVRVTDQDDAEAMAALRQDLEARVGAPAHASGVGTVCRVVFGEARDTLVQQIVDEDADLAIIGDAGHWGLVRPHLGSVASYLVHHSPRPLAVVPGAGGPLRGGRLVVGLDGSPDSRAALDWAATLAAPLGAAIVAVGCYDPLADSYPHGPNASAWHAEFEPKVRAEVAAVGDRDVDINVRLLGAHPAEGLLEVAADVNASAVLVGARGRGGFHRLLVGGTAMQLLHHSDRPVIVIPTQPGNGRGGRA